MAEGSDDQHQGLSAGIPATRTLATGRPPVGSPEPVGSSEHVRGPSRPLRCSFRGAAADRGLSDPVHDRRRRDGTGIRGGAGGAGRSVALKVIQPGGVSGESLARFESSQSHPNSTIPASRGSLMRGSSVRAGIIPRSCRTLSMELRSRGRVTYADHCRQSDVTLEAKRLADRRLPQPAAHARCGHCPPRSQTCRTCSSRARAGATRR